MESAITIDQLPDYVLLKIIDKLDLAELYVIYNACQRLQSIAELVLKKRYENFDYVKELQPFDYFQSHPFIRLTDITATIGKYVSLIYFDGTKLRQTLPVAMVHLIDDIDNYNQLYEHDARIHFTLKTFPYFMDFLKLLEKDFGNLHSIEMGFYPLCTPLFEEKDVDANVNFSHCKSLKIAEFHISDKMLTEFYEVWPFKRLTLLIPDLYKSDGLEWSGITGKFLQSFSGMESLTLIDCNKIKPQYFTKFCTSDENKNTLKHLRLSECEQLNLNKEIFKFIGDELENLQSLSLRFTEKTPNLMHLTNLTNLKILNLQMAEDVDDLIVALSKRKSNIEQLILEDCLVEFSELKFIEHEFFTQLKQLNVKGNVVCDDILERFAKYNPNLSILCLNYSSDVTNGLIGLIECAKHLHIIDMYCNEWITEDLLKSIVNVLLADAQDDAIKRPQLKLILTFELWEEADVKKLLKLKESFNEFTEKNYKYISIEYLNSC